MLALYRDGRQGEALATYRHARQLLIEELGAEPGPELQDLHQRVLAADAALAAHEPGQPMASGARPAVPHQLPAAVRHFAGRSRELAELTLRLDQAAADTEGTVVISAIDGMAGIGKTALAVHAAHQLAAKFPDGQLFLDLHGYTQGQAPRTAGRPALNWLLRALGVPFREGFRRTASRPPRSTASGSPDTRTLIVLDNAATEGPGASAAARHPARAWCWSPVATLWPGWSPGTAPGAWTWICCPCRMRSACCGR